VLVAVLLPIFDRKMIFSGVVLGFFLVYADGFCVAKRPWRRHGPGDRFVTAHTTTGVRTIDLHDLRSVRSWTIPSRVSFTGTPRIVLTDRSGIRLSFDLSVARSVLSGELLLARGQGERTNVYVSRFALADLGYRPLPRFMAPLRNLGALERIVLTIFLPAGLSFLLAMR
jgi:hypothetical protein